MIPSGPSRQHSDFGLSNATTAPDKRKLLDLIGRLGETGAGVDVSLPMILPVGCQSSGKSSVLEGITGVAFPRGNGTCTRSPLECQLRRTNGAREFVVSLKTIFDQQGRPLGQGRCERFGDVMHNREDIADRVQRAHRAILSPNTDYRVFLNATEEDFPERELDFTRNSVLLQISGPDVEDLSLCDLPGLLVNPDQNGSTDANLVQNLVSGSISNPACIILLTVSCETDPQNQVAPNIVRQYDRDWSRTIGVLTMPDRMRAGTQRDWLQYLRGNTVPLQHGWFCVRRPDFNNIQAGMTRDGALQMEAGTFSEHPWSSLSAEEQARLGIDRLRRGLSDVLAGVIFQMLPDIRGNIEKQMDDTDEKLAKLPKPPSSEPILEISRMIIAFSNGLNAYIQGTAGANRPIQRLRDLCEVCRKAILDTEPICQPRARASGESGPKRRSATYARDSIKPSPEAPDDKRVIDLDDVVARMNGARGRELPNHWPDSVAKEYVKDIIDQWLAPVNTLFRQYSVVLEDGLRGLVDVHFGQYPYLRDRVRIITTSFLKDLKERTRTRIEDLLEMEKLVQTVHEGRYHEAYEKHAAKYTNSAPASASASVDESMTATLGASMGGSFKACTRRSSGDTSSTVDLQAGFSLYAGINMETREGKARRAQIDSACEVMASVSAYFEVSNERFTDNVRNAIDFYFALGLVRGQALETALYKDLDIGSADARSRCAEFLREPSDVAERRESLMKKQERLTRAREVIDDAAIC